MQDDKSVTEEKEDSGNTQKSAENESESENDYSDEDEDITEFKPGQIRPTPSPVLIVVYVDRLGIWRSGLLRVSV